MNRYVRNLTMMSAVGVTLCVAARPIAAQDRPADEPNPPWKAELSKLPTPRAGDGKPNLNGIWLRARHAVEARLGPNNVPGGSLTQDEKGNITVGVMARGGGPGAETYINFERDAGVRLRTEPNKPLYKPEYWDHVQDLDERGNFEDPAFTCYPYGLPRAGAPDKIVQTPTEMIFLYRARNEFRVIPTDGRPLPPVDQWEGISWYGKSVGRWEGDTLVIESVDFTDQSWLGWAGYFHSNDMKVTERIRREGNTLVWQATVEDPQVLIQPWVMNPWTLRLESDPKATLQEDLPCRDYDQRHMQTNERG